jgi:DNA-binding LytR/AlgR family response regulator
MPIALIVEDEPLLAAELRDQLAALWPELEIAGQAENGVEAISLLDSVKPDVVFLDIQIPGLTGMEVAAHVGENVQIVFVTAYAEHAVQAFEAGAVDYIVKPVTAARLLQTVKRLKTRSTAPVPACRRDLLPHAGAGAVSEVDQSLGRQHGAAGDGA